LRQLREETEAEAIAAANNVRVNQKSKELLKAKAGMFLFSYCCQIFYLFPAG
jgi:hypothetical protein